MKRVAFVFSSAPHGSASGREGLDALLATSALSDEIGVFFVGDGVLPAITSRPLNSCRCTILTRAGYVQRLPANAA